MKLIKGITFYLQEDEARALSELSQKELRDPRAQAYLIVRQELFRLGYLKEQKVYSPCPYCGTEQADMIGCPAIDCPGKSQNA